MKKTSTLLVLIIICLCSKASVNYWVSSQQSGNWSDAGNWANGTPSVNDTVFFDGVITTVNVDVNPNIAGLQIINSSNVVLSSNNTRLITIGNGGSSGLLVFKITKGSSLTIEGTVATKGVSIQTFGNFTTTNAVVDGNFIFGAYACTWNVNSFPSSFCTTTITGTVRVTANNTGSVISGGLSNGNPGTVTFASTSILDWQRSGGSAPNANFANGSHISVKGITGSNITFNSSARYDGVLVWDCAAQTINGSNALLLPSGNSVMDSVRIVNTGTGSVRLATNPNGYSINSLEIDGGILELSAPNSNFNNLTDTITTEFKITGGTVYGNATFTFDNLGAAYSNTLFIKGSFVMTGGVFDFTNRNGGNAPGGSFAMYVKGNVLQTGGTIKASKGFDALNLLVLNGNVTQNMSIHNMIDTISVVINNLQGVSLQNNVILPYKLQLQGGYLQLNQYNAAIQAGRIIQSATLPLPCIVTNGNGTLSVNNITGSQLFPIAPFTGGYNAFTVTNSSASPKNYAAKVMYGIEPAGDNLDILKMINRTWAINSTVSSTDDNTSFTFYYADSERVAGATVNPAAAMVLGHYTNGWTYDSYSPATPSGGPVSYTAGPFTAGSVDSFFVIGNAGFITGTYIFTGTGNWNMPANWVGNTVPPDPLPAGKEIIIDPSSGDCILNTTQTISPGARIRISKNKNLLLPSNLIIQ